MSSTRSDVPNRLARWLCAPLLGLLALHVWAQPATGNWPSRPITIVVPFTPGGGTDTLSRMVAQSLTAALGQTVISENKPGAGGSIGTKAVAGSAPDGHTLLIGTSSTHGINPWVYPRLGYDVLKDFEPIAVLAITDYALGVPQNSPARSVSDLVAARKADKVLYGSSGNGTTTHLAGVLLSNMTGSDFVHVPYKSSGPALQDLMAGELTFLFDNTSVLVPLAKAGRLRILATSGSVRSAATPDIPTVGESGVGGYAVIGWWALFAPANTPAPIVERLQREVGKTLGDSAFRQRINDMGYIAKPAMSSAETRDFLRTEYEKFGSIVKAAGVKLD